MKKFLFKILIFLILLFITCLVIEILLRRIPNDYSYKSNYLSNNSDSIEILFLGGSHSLFGINPVYSERKSFNASNPSQSIDYDLEILKKYRNKWSNLKCIVIPISYGSLTETIVETPEAWRIKNYVIYFKIMKSKYLPYYAEILNGQLLTNIYRLNNYYVKKNDNIDCTELGWNTSYSSEKHKDLNKTGVEASKRHTVRNLQKFDEMTIILDSIASFAKNCNSKLLIFTSPAYESYRANLDHEQLNKTINSINKVVTNNSHCYYFNLLEDSTFTARDFYDGDHLNEIGAKKLTLKIDSIINLLIP